MKRIHPTKYALDVFATMGQYIVQNCKKIFKKSPFLNRSLKNHPINEKATIK